MSTIDKKQLIDEAAYIVFKELGFKNANISTITKQAGIATGSFYNYYSSKEEIFLKVYIIENNRLRERLKEEIDWSRDPLSIVQKIFLFTLEEQNKNKILNEWNNTSINYLMRDYYNSIEGKSEYPFLQYVIEKFKDKLREMNFNEIDTIKVLNTLEFIFSIDTKLDHTEFTNYNESFQYLTENFIKGIFQ